MEPAYGCLCGGGPGVGGGMPEVSKFALANGNVAIRANVPFLACYFSSYIRWGPTYHGKAP